MVTVSASFTDENTPRIILTTEVFLFEEENRGVLFLILFPSQPFKLSLLFQTKGWLSFPFCVLPTLWCNTFYLWKILLILILRRVVLQANSFQDLTKYTRLIFRALDASCCFYQLHSFLCRLVRRVRHRKSNVIDFTFILYSWQNQTREQNLFSWDSRLSRPWVWRTCLLVCDAV